MAWHKQTNYGLRALVELAILRYITIIGPKLKARALPQQKTEAAISDRVLNRMTVLCTNRLHICSIHCDDPLYFRKGLGPLLPTLPMIGSPSHESVYDYLDAQTIPRA